MSKFKTGDRVKVRRGRHGPDSDHVYGEVVEVDEFEILVKFPDAERPVPEGGRAGWTFWESELKRDKRRRPDHPTLDEVLENIDRVLESIEPDGVSLKLTQDEAEVLRLILGHIGGSGWGRDRAHGVAIKLHDAGVRNSLKIEVVPHASQHPGITLKDRVS